MKTSQFGIFLISYYFFAFCNSSFNDTHRRYEMLKFKFDNFFDLANKQFQNDGPKMGNNLKNLSFNFNFNI